MVKMLSMEGGWRKDIWMPPEDVKCPSTWNVIKNNLYFKDFLLITAMMQLILWFMIFFSD